MASFNAKSFPGPHAVRHYESRVYLREIQRSDREGPVNEWDL